MIEEDNELKYSITVDLTCPRCHGRVKIPDHAIENMISYRSSCDIVTDCCNLMIHATTNVYFKVSSSDAEEDDWGDIPKDITSINKLEHI